MNPLVADFYVSRGTFTLQVDFTFPAGEITAVIGPNGAGKTTLLQALAGFLPITGGRLVSGATIWADTETSPRVHLPPHLRSAALLPQSSALFPHLTVAQNILFGPRSQKQPDQSETLKFWLEELALTDLADRLPEQISGGQQQRVALARAFAANPDLLLLDEPTSALDVSGAEQFRESLRLQLAARPTTTILISHSPADVLALADNVLVIELGKITHDSSLQDLWEAPPPGFAAAFTGVNTLPAQLVSQEFTQAVVRIENQLIYGRTSDAMLEPEVYLSVHPEKLRLSSTPCSDSQNQWSTFVRSVSSFTGGYTIELESPAGLVAHLSPNDFWAGQIRVGARVSVSVDPSEVVLTSA